MHPSSSIYDIECTDLAGRPFPLKQFRGQPLLIVNTASLCSFSSQFKALEKIWQNNRDKSLVVLGVPTNDFGHQESGSSRQILSLCSLKFGITFPFLAKTSVKGQDAHPMFQYIANESGFWARPRWNFYKYVVGRDGHLVDWFSSLADPLCPRISRALAKASQSG